MVKVVWERLCSLPREVISLFSGRGAQGSPKEAIKTATEKGEGFEP